MMVLLLLLEQLESNRNQVVDLFSSTPLQGNLVTTVNGKQDGTEQGGNSCLVLVRSVIGGKASTAG